MHENKSGEIENRSEKKTEKTYRHTRSVYNKHIHNEIHLEEGIRHTASPPKKTIHGKVQLANINASQRVFT